MMCFFKKNSKLIIIPVLILFPVIFIGILKMFINFVPGEMIGSIDGWLGFLGGYFGVLGAVGTVWWQLNEEKNKVLNIKIEEQNIKKKMLSYILDEAYSRIDMTKNEILTFLNPIIEIRGKINFYYILDKDMLKIIFDTTFLVEEQVLINNLYEIYYRISRLEIFLAQYLNSIGSKYNFFKNNINSLKKENFLILDENENKIKISNKVIFKQEIYVEYCQIINNFNQICLKYKNNTKFFPTEKEYKEIKDTVIDLITIFNKAFDGEKRTEILDYLVSYHTLLIQMEQFLYGKRNLENTKKLIKDTYNLLIISIKAVEE